MLIIRLFKIKKNSGCCRVKSMPIKPRYSFQKLNTYIYLCLKIELLFDST